ncbi:hypothetical protein EDD22DRAFT_582469 [Suillus occidentalis]|nr:hypothetical protein EDD22DRAFT_582469 [Suillus occidentalis]
MMDIDMDSSVGPVIVTNYDESHSHGISVYGAEFDLCELLQTLTLSKGKTKVGTSPSLSHKSLTPQWRKAPENDPTVPVVPYALQRASEDAVNTEDPAYHSDAESSSSKSSSCDPHTTTTTSTPTNHLPNSSILVPRSPLPACHFLQSILASLAPESHVLSPSPYPYPASSHFRTTGGEYLDTILTHRALLSAFPPAHRGCAIALQEIARAVEVRAWRADRESDAEAVATLRQEAFLTSTWL